MSINNRWFQLCASLIAMIMIANLQYAWTLFVGPLQEGTGWRLSDIQFAFTLFILFQTWVQPLDGWLIDRLGPRGFITVAGCSAVSGGQAWATRRRSRCCMRCIAWLAPEPRSSTAGRSDPRSSGSRKSAASPPGSWPPASAAERRCSSRSSSR